MKFRVNATQVSRRITFAKSLGFLFVVTSILAFLLFYAVDLMDGSIPYKSPVFIFDGFHGYHLTEIRENPFPYLLALSFLLALLGACWITIIAPKHRRYPYIQILAIPWAAVILTSPVWGLIWSINRWPPQSFSDTDVMLLFYRHDIMEGLCLGWLSAILSFPINVLSYVTACSLLVVSHRLFDNYNL